MQGRRAGIISVAALLLLPILSHLVEFDSRHSCNPLGAYSGLMLPAGPLPWAGRCFVDGNAGLTLQALGHRAAEDWLNFTVPWWNPYAGIGMPLAAEMQPGAFFLPLILLLHFTNGLLLLKIATQIIAGACMVYCLRSLGLGQSAALFGGLLYELDGTFAWYGDAPMLPLPFLPLLVAGIERARASAQNSQPGGVPAIAAGIGFSLLAGFPETAFLNGVLAVLWAAVRLLAVSGGAKGRLIKKLLVGGMAGIALAAPALIPFLDYLASGAVTYRGLVQVDQLRLGQEAALLLPTVFGPPYFDMSPAWGEAGGYLGAALVLPGLAALIARGHYAGLRGLAAIWTAFWLAVFLGEPITRYVWQALPLLNQAVVTRYAMPSIAFLWTVLAALGWDRIRAGGNVSPAAPLVFLGLAVASLLHVVLSGRLGVATFLPLQIAPMATAAWTAFVTAAFVSLTWRLGAWRLRLSEQLVAPSLAAILLADALVSFMVPQLAGTPVGRLDTAPIAFLRSQANFVRSYALGGLLEPNYGSFFGVPTIQAFTLPAPPLWAGYAPDLDPRLMGEMFAPKSLTAQALRLQVARRAFEDSGVGYVLVPPGTDPINDLHDTHFVPIFESLAARIYQLPGAKPYFDIVSGGPCAVAPKDHDSTTIACVAPAVLLRREMFDPGWHATVNGIETSVTQADGVFQSVSLPAGNSLLRFRYVPAHATLIATSLLLAVGALTGSLCRIWRISRAAVRAA